MEINQGTKIYLHALPDAFQRTKNRIREHGNEGFIIENFVPHSGLFNGRPALLLRSVTKSWRGEEWLGWIPWDEVNI